MDRSGSEADATIQDAQMKLVRRIADAVAMQCGRIVVELFAGSLGSVRTAFDGDVIPAGQTPQTRDRNRSGVVANVVAATARAMAAGNVDNLGSDPFGILQRASWVLASSHSKIKVAFVATDGIENAAHDAPVLPLAGVHVIVAGIGHTAGNPPDSATVSNLIRKWKKVCEASHAASCEVTGSLTSFDIGFIERT